MQDVADPGIAPAQHVLSPGRGRDIRAGHHQRYRQRGGPREPGPRIQAPHPEVPIQPLALLLGHERRQRELGDGRVQALVHQQKQATTCVRVALSLPVQVVCPLCPDRIVAQRHRWSQEPVHVGFASDAIEFGSKDKAGTAPAFKHGRQPQPFDSVPHHLLAVER